VTRGCACSDRIVHDPIARARILFGRKPSLSGAGAWHRECIVNRGEK
jgi:hypothetical protein